MHSFPKPSYISSPKDGKVSKSNWSVVNYYLYDLFDLLYDLFDFLTSF